MGDKRQPEIDLNPEGFTAVRNGLKEHIKRGRLDPTALGVYLYLQMECDWKTGVYHGTALGIAFGFGEPTIQRLVKEALFRLRERKFINYREGDGKRKGYDILIHKFRPTLGNLKGKELDAWAKGKACQPVYQPLQQPVDSQSPAGRQPEDVPVDRPIPDLPEDLKRSDLTEEPHDPTQGDSPSASSTQEDQKPKSLAFYVDDEDDEDYQQSLTPTPTPKPTPPVREVFRPAPEPVHITSRKNGHIFGRRLCDNGSRCVRCKMHYQLWESRGKPSCAKEETDEQEAIANF